MLPAHEFALATNLRRLRSARGWSQVEMAEKAGLSRIGYRNIEDGASDPKPETLMAIALAFAVPIAQLLMPVRAFTRVRFRAQKKLHSRDEVLADVARQLDHYAQLEKLLGAETTGILAKLQKKCSVFAGAQRPIEAAHEARSALGLKPEQPVLDLCGLLEDHGIKVLTPAVASEGFFGLSVGNAGGGPAIAVNTWERISVERWIFTAAHELGHLLLHLNAYDVTETQEDENQEQEADVFAGHFLMPETLFQKELQAASGLSWYDRIFKLKRLFRVSYRSVLYRIVSELPAEQRRTVWMRFNAEYKRNNGGRSLPGTVKPDALPPDVFFRQPTGKSSEEPERLERHDFMQNRLARLVRKALEQDEITFGKAAEILDLSAEDMRELANSWAE